VDPIALARALVDIDSTTGREAEAGRWLAHYLREAGFTVTEQPVDGGRFNVIASVGTPVIVLSTHVDCVPPFFPSRVEGDRLYGRGACDAKGILAAQVAASRPPAPAGRDARRPAVRRRRGTRQRWRPRGQRGGGRVSVSRGRGADRQPSRTRDARHAASPAPGQRAAAHSSYPELGESAIDKLIDALVELRTIGLPQDAILGTTHYTVGLISGGVAPNVVPPSAEAEVMFRTVSDASHVRQAIARLERRVQIEPVLEVPPIRLTTVPGFDTAVFPYTTDIPFLSRWGQPLLFGPGSIHLAHTADEYISIDQVHAAVDHYVTIARQLLAR